MKTLAYPIYSGLPNSPSPHMSNLYNSLSLPSPSFITNRTALSKPTLSSFIYQPSSLSCFPLPSRIISNKNWIVCCCAPQEPSSASGAEEFDLQRSKSFGRFSDSEVDSEKASEKVEKVADGIFRFHGEPWTVPWTAETILQVMLLWIASSWLVESWIIPFLADAARFGIEPLTYRSQALYMLLTYVAEGLAGIAILHHCLAKFRPLPGDWFRFTLRGDWQFDVWLGCLMFPLVICLSQVNINLLPQLLPDPVGASCVEQSIVAQEPVARALYAVLVLICGPIWEEIIFRGFLLPSLTRYMPVWGSILVSAVAFALIHFNARRLLPLVFLGIMMGTVFARSRNLLASMLLHSLWNGFVFVVLTK